MSMILILVRGKQTTPCFYIQKNLKKQYKGSDARLKLRFVCFSTLSNNPHFTLDYRCKIESHMITTLCRWEKEQGQASLKPMNRDVINKHLAIDSYNEARAQRNANELRGIPYD
jgi:hypothetical protein